MASNSFLDLFQYLINVPIFSLIHIREPIFSSRPKIKGKQSWKKSATDACLRCLMSCIMKLEQRQRNIEKHCFWKLRIFAAPSLSPKIILEQKTCPYRHFKENPSSPSRPFPFAQIIPEFCFRSDEAVRSVKHSSQLKGIEWSTLY